MIQFGKNIQIGSTFGNKYLVKALPDLFLDVSAIPLGQHINIGAFKTKIFDSLSYAVFILIHWVPLVEWHEEEYALVAHKGQYQ